MVKIPINKIKKKLEYDIEKAATQECCTFKIRDLEYIKYSSYWDWGQFYMEEETKVWYFFDVNETDVVMINKLPHGALLAILGHYVNLDKYRTFLMGYVPQGDLAEESWDNEMEYLDEEIAEVRLIMEVIRREIKRRHDSIHKPSGFKFKEKQNDAS